MLAHPKPRPRLLDKRDKARGKDRLDRAERAKCKARSGGVCEVVEVAFPQIPFISRCSRRAVHNHHLISGIGRRNAGASILAEHRIEVCEQCHREIHGRVLVPVGQGRESAGFVAFERVE
jgi:hypothetical protein